MYLEDEYGCNLPEIDPDYLMAVKAIANLIDRNEVIKVLEGMMLTSQEQVNNLRWWQHNSDRYRYIQNRTAIYNGSLREAITKIKEIK